jgi:hemerythrin superfamily protein
MNPMMSRLSPDATTMIRMDHTHVVATFHKYRVGASPARKRALANTICLALEIHAKIEEEIFYPAMRKVDPELVDKSIPEHNEMRRLIAQLREADPADPSFERSLMELMRDVLRHVADEETMLLPDAERVLGDRLGELGARMTRRRLELMAPKAGQIAIDTMRTFPVPLLAMSGLLVVGAFLAGRAITGADRPRLAELAPRRLRARLR